MRNGQMERIIKVTFIWERKKVMASSVYQMAPPTRDNSKTTLFRATVTSSGLMANSTKVFGRPIKCMERETLYGLMEDVMKDSISRVKKMALDNFSGQMEEYIVDNGDMASRMAEVSTKVKMASRRQAFGVMERR